MKAKKALRIVEGIVSCYSSMYEAHELELRRSSSMGERREHLEFLHYTNKRKLEDVRDIIKQWRG